MIQWVKMWGSANDKNNPDSHSFSYFQKKQGLPCLKNSPLAVSSKSRIFNDGLKFIKYFEVLWGVGRGKNLDLLDVQTLQVFTFSKKNPRKFLPSSTKWHTPAHGGQNTHRGPAGPASDRRGYSCGGGQPGPWHGLCRRGDGQWQGDSGFLPRRPHARHGCPETRACHAACSAAPHASDPRWRWRELSPRPPLGPS